MKYQSTKFESWTWSLIWRQSLKEISIIKTLVNNYFSLEIFCFVVFEKAPSTTSLESHYIKSCHLRKVKWGTEVIIIHLFKRKKHECGFILHFYICWLYETNLWKISPSLSLTFPVKIKKAKCGVIDLSYQFPYPMRFSEGLSTEPWTYITAIIRALKSLQNELHTYFYM